MSGESQLKILSEAAFAVYLEFYYKNILKVYEQEQTRLDVQFSSYAAKREEYLRNVNKVQQELSQLPFADKKIVERMIDQLIALGYRVIHSAQSPTPSKNPFVSTNLEDLDPVTDYIHKHKKQQLS